MNIKTDKWIIFVFICIKESLYWIFKIYKSGLKKLFSWMFLPGSGGVDTAVWMHNLDANKTAREEARRQLHKNVASNIE